MRVVLPLVLALLAPAAHGNDQFNALSSLYVATGGPSWTNKEFWMTGSDPCTPNEWEGSTCTSGAVKELDLAANNLAGALPTQLGLLILMTKNLVLDNNLLSSTLPSVRQSFPDDAAMIL